MKHYFNPMSRAITTRWMLLEADVPHEQVFVDITNGDTDRAEYRAVNPMAKSLRSWTVTLSSLKPPPYAPISRTSFLKRAWRPRLAPQPAAHTTATYLCPAQRLSQCSPSPP